MSEVDEIVARLRRGELAYKSGSTAVYHGPTVFDTKVAETISQLQEEIARLREALKPFSADKFPCSRRTKIAYNEWGLRCLMSDMEIARMAARAALGGSND